MEGELLGNTSKGGQVALPLDNEQFTKFITSLLGKPRKFEQKFAFPFDITTSDVKDTFHLVEQRVHEQNTADLVQYTVDVAYNDGSSVSHACLDDFINYQEVKPLIPSSIVMSWTYLIHFPKRGAPEKQNIEVSFISHGSHFSPEYSCEGVNNWFKHAVGMVEFTVSHTSISWGNDIDSLLTNHIKTYEKNESNFRKWCRNYSSKVSGIFFMLVFFMGLIGLITTTYLLTESEREVAKVLIDQGDTITLGEKIDYLIKIFSMGSWPRYFFSSFLFVIVLIVGAIFGSAAIERISGYKEPSFILISKTSKKHKDEVLEKLSNSWRKYVGVILGGIVTGVLANIVFTWVWLP